MTKTEPIESQQQEIEKARFLFDVAVKSDEMIQKANERINDKIKGFMSIAAALVPIIVGVGYFVLKQESGSWTFVLFILFFLSLGTLIAAIGVGIYIQRPLEYRVFNPYKMMKKYHKKNQRFMTNKYAITWSHTVHRNLKKIEHKEYYIKLMLILIFCSLALLVVTFFLMGIIPVWQS
jgi:hypothetical protein